MNKQCLICGKMVRPETRKVQVAGSIDRIGKPTGVWRCSCGGVMRTALHVDRQVVKLRLNYGRKEEIEVNTPVTYGGRVAIEDETPPNKAI